MFLTVVTNLLLESVGYSVTVGMSRPGVGLCRICEIPSWPLDICCVSNCTSAKKRIPQPDNRLSVETVELMLCYPISV